MYKYSKNNMKSRIIRIIIAGLLVGSLTLTAPAEVRAEGESKTQEAQSNNNAENKEGETSNANKEGEASDTNKEKNDDTEKKEKAGTGKWVESSGRWWYDNGDGTYAKNEYIDGYWLDGSGWYAPSWYGSWKSNAAGWWFESSGWYPKNDWLKIDHNWYYFTSSGYMVSKDWVKYNGGWYYFYENGTMAVSTTIDGYELDATGRWEDKTPVKNLIANSETAKKTSQIVLVNDHELTLWEKQSDGTWKGSEPMYCGYGLNGFIDPESRRMGSKTTPKGSYELTYAFGKAENPGTKMSYYPITPYSYLSSEKDTYNQWVESTTKVTGEHLIDYYQYKYAVNIGFNINPTVYGRGAGIFLHCKSYNSWNTAGCVSLEESNMVWVLKQLKNGAYMIIVSDKSEIRSY